MEEEMALVQMLVSSDQIAAQHLDFIKTSGEKGCSAIAALAVIENLEMAEPNRHLVLKTEYFILRTLTQAMQEELIRMEEKN